MSGISLNLYRHSRAERGNPARAEGTVLKLLEISEIRDFEDDGTGVRK